MHFEMDRHDKRCVNVPENALQKGSWSRDNVGTVLDGSGHQGD